MAYYILGGVTCIIAGVLKSRQDIGKIIQAVLLLLFTRMPINLYLKIRFYELPQPLSAGHKNASVQLFPKVKPQMLQTGN